MAKVLRLKMSGLNVLLVDTASGKEQKKKHKNCEAAILWALASGHKVLI